MKLTHTRAMLTAALSGRLGDVGYSTDPIFGVSIPETCPDVPAQVLNPGRYVEGSKGVRDHGPRSGQSVR